MDACADGNPERDENAGKADQAEGNATRFYTETENCRYEGVDSKDLVRCI